MCAELSYKYIVYGAHVQLNKGVAFGDDIGLFLLCVLSIYVS